LAKIYAEAVNDWLLTNKEKLNNKNNHVFVQTDACEAVSFAEACELIERYSNFIAFKIHRAYFKIEEYSNTDLVDKMNLFRDNIGSAKIAINLCNLSIGAFSALNSECYECQNEILKFISQLLLIKNKLLQTFPDVMRFKRPGFD
jgi:hypothetical protein